MDDKDLEALFRAAPGDPPPSRFGLADVTAASVRAGARRRSMMLLSAICAVLLLGAAGVAGLAYFRANETSSAQPANAPGPPPGTLVAPTPLQGSGGNGKDGPRAEGTQAQPPGAGCEKIDRALATTLAAELPATGTTGPVPGRVCPAATRSAGFHVTDGDRTGVVSVTVFPAGTPVALPANTISAQQPAASGGTVVVMSTPDPRSTRPFQSDLSRIAAAIAPKITG